MKKVILACVLLVSSMPVPALAQAGAELPLRSGRCMLQIHGTNRINGRCLYRIETDGSFYIREAGRRGDDFYFAYVNKTSANTASASWSGSRASSHAHDELGDVTRHGACWTNRMARLCLWAR
jgi:hypothetical protein